ncbi:MAG: hypothetical protein KC636_15635, partial [Myxococcales bacterium]|nr:hypothetical protein [Myxococcales bacterium]
MGADVAGDARLLAAQRRVAAARAEGDAALDEALVELHRLYAELRSHDEARTISGELVELWRGGASEVALAKALTLHAIDWRRAVGYPQAIEAASEAIELYDALAQPLERAVGESLARALECLAGSLAILRRDAESLAARERLAATLQTIGAPRERVADVLCDLATSQRRHGTLAGEVQARRQAIAVLRPLTEEDPERHGAALLEALSALEQTLKHAGSSESALAQRERLETLERLARHDLARYGDHLLAAYDAAPPRTDEDPSAWRRTLSLRVQLTRSLAERWPARYTPRRVQALLEQGATLREACFVEDALAPALEAMLLLEQLAVHEYDAEGSWLVDALVECGTLLWRLERWDASLSMRSAAIDVLGARGRREDRTRAVELRFDYAEELLLAERYEDAVAVGREAMAALRGCCDVRTPELRDLTAGLVRLGELERMAGHGAAASSSFREVAALVRALVEQHDDDG